MPKNNVSKCCRSELFVVSANDGTSYYSCAACGKASDPYIAPKKRVKKENSFDSNVGFRKNSGSFEIGELSKTRPCPKGCIGDEKHLHVTYTNGDTQTYSDSSNLNKTIQNHQIYTKLHTWSRRIMLVVLGGLCVMAYFRFTYEIHWDALGDLILLKK